MIEKIMQDIKNDFSEMDVCKILDEEVLNWVEDNWEEEHEDEYEWYASYGHGEAETAIINQLINYWVKNYHNGKTLDKKTYLEAYNNIKKEYYPLGRD